MKIYLASLGAGVFVGIIYSLMDVRSPAPPLVALVGLLGILVGEQVIPVSRHLLSGSPFRAAWEQSSCGTHIFGMLPGRQQATIQSPSASSSETPS